MQMRDHDIFKDRERGLEAEYVMKHEAELLEKLRAQAKLDEIAAAMAANLKVSDPALLHRIVELGVTLETGAAFLLAPLVQVAWAGGEVTEAERDAVLGAAVSRGVERDSPAYAQLVAWLRERPSDALFDTALQAIKAGIAVLPPDEHAERVKRIAQGCHMVAAASGGGIRRILGLDDGVSHEEEALLEAITATLRAG